MVENEKLSPLQREILKKWQGKEGRSISQDIKDTLEIRFDGEVLFDEPMSRHTYVKVGGPAEVFLQPRSREALVLALRLAQDHNIPCYFHGAGANTLVKDGGVKGFVISTYGCLTEFGVVAQSPDYIDIKAASGVNFQQLIRLAKELGAADFAPFHGIPGSVGGFVSMNAGARGREIKDVLRSVTVLTKQGEEVQISREKLDFQYRSLKIAKSTFILDTTFRLEDLVAPEEVEALLKQYQKKRTDTQPLDLPSLGSVFKNPQPAHKKEVVSPAGRLIEEAGLKNIRIGGARISQKHANFIVNEGEAKAKDILSLIGMIRDKVKQTAGIVLETEVKIIGEDE